jgi:DNA-binding response OmpR family regulator
VHERLLTESKINFLFSRPFPFRQMSAEMRYAIFHQKEKMEFGKYILRDLELDLARHQVKLSDQSLYLRNKEFSLLHYLMVNKGKVLSRSDILENVWDRNANILTNTVDVHISQLRKKMGEGKNQKYIHTIPCTGYIFE